jgi:hypothetical protein
MFSWLLIAAKAVGYGYGLASYLGRRTNLFGQRR